MDSFSITSKMDSLPQLSPIVEKIEFLLSKDIISEIKKGKNRLDLVSGEIQKVVNRVLPKIRANIAEAEKTLNENVDRMNAVLAEPIEHIHFVQNKLTESNQFVVTNNSYVYVLRAVLFGSY